MVLRKFRSPADCGINSALKNKYGFALQDGNNPYVICFSGAEKFLDIFSRALIFSFVLSFVLRQKKEHPLVLGLELLFDTESYVDGCCSFSFACPKENEPKEKGAPRKRSRHLLLSGSSRPRRTRRFQYFAVRI